MHVEGAIGAKAVPSVPQEGVAKELIRLSSALARERDITALLARVLDTARRLTHAEAGRVYTLDVTQRLLKPVVVQNTRAETPINHLSDVALSVGGKANMAHVAAYCAVSGKTVNLSDVYAATTFDFSDIYRLDQMTGYRTRSLYCVSLRAHEGQTLGVLQLMNFCDPLTHAPLQLSPGAETLVNALASFAALTLTRAKLLEENGKLVEALHAANRQLSEVSLSARRRPGRSRRRSAMVGASPAMNRLFELVETVAGRDVTVLVQGETGSGKERVARAIHDLSGRKGPFVAQNCTALPEALLESELFGHVKGAFSGATANHPGLLVAAEGGTVFLDEIGDMPLSLQAKLLRVLQEREVRPVGAVRSVPIDVRVVAATHRNLRDMIAEGTFREDLYFRLAVFPVEVPALRERADDVPLLIDDILGELRERHGKPVAGVSPAAFRALTSYGYPGNVRELANILERAYLLCEADGHISLSDLPTEVAEAAATDAVDAMTAPAEDTEGDGEAGGGLKELVERAEAQIIARSLRAHDWNQTRAAEALGVSRRTLVEKIAKYGLRRRSQPRNV